MCPSTFFFLVARHLEFPSVNPCLEFQRTASSRRNDRAKQIPLSSSCRRIISFMQPPTCLQRVLPRVGDNGVRFITCESHECCSTNSRLCTARFSFVEIGRNSRSMGFCVISATCSAHLGLLDHTCKERLRLFRPLLKTLPPCQ